MNRFFTADRRFSTYLVVGFIILLVLSTLSAGVPAYWLTRTQLERQAWSTVANAQQATHSLLLAEQNRLSNLATLFAERPTLQRILREKAWTELPPYLQAFQAQSQLDLLLLCQSDQHLSGGAGQLATCPTIQATHFALFDGRPVLWVTHKVSQASGAPPVATVIAGLWLDDEFMRQMARNTGLQQSIVTFEGTRLSSSFANTTTQTLAVPTQPLATADLSNRQLLTIEGQPFYVLFMPLQTTGTLAPFRLAVALPVTTLLTTEKNALLILIASTLLVALVGSLLAGWYIRQLTRPLGELTRVAERIGKGDYMTPIPAFATPVEVATLSTAFIRSQASMLRTLEEQSQARRWLDNLVQSIVEGVITIDGYGRVTFLSQSAEALSGWDSLEAFGQSLNCLFLPAGEDAKPFLDQMPRPGARRQIDVVNRQGKAMTLSVTGARLAPPTGVPMQTALVLRDVTHEEALRHLRSYFLANISHEFKTPLSTLNASLELLLDDVDRLTADELAATEMREVLKPAHMSLLGLQNLIDNLLQSSTIEAGHFVIHKRPLRMQQILDDTLLLVQPLLDRRRQPLGLHNLPAIDHIQGDPARLTQVLVNLLVNASKYSPLGEPIDLSGEIMPTKVRIAVADRGPGIPAAERLNLFRRFVRLDTTPMGALDKEAYGIGLGLYVVKTTIEAHGGQVGVDDRPDGGSIFWFELPRDAA